MTPPLNSIPKVFRHHTLVSTMVSSSPIFGRSPSWPQTPVGCYVVCWRSWRRDEMQLDQGSWGDTGGPEPREFPAIVYAVPKFLTRQRDHKTPTR